jgi:hypothetical protein
MNQPGGSRESFRRSCAARRRHTRERTRQYIYDFDEAVASSRGGEKVVAKMTAKYPDLGNPYTLWLAAYTQSYVD